MYVVKEYNEQAISNQLDALRVKWGTYKVIPEAYTLPILTALSHFPELKNTHIHFVVVKSRTLFPYASRPDWKSLFKPEDKRKYLIVIQDYPGADEEIQLKNLPFNAQIGILGHELAHTSFYQSKGIASLIKIGILYFYPPFRTSFEKDTDKSTIAHGLGYQLFDYANYIRKIQSFIDKSSWIDKYYLTPKEVERYMQSFPEYQK